MNPKRLHVFLLAAVGMVLLWSLYKPKEYFTWLLEAAPAIIGICILIMLFNRFRFTDLVYVLVAIHAVILLVGGHYTYAEVPLFNWIRDTFGHARNNYDKVGHFAQGFVPAIIAREVLLRASPLKRGGWLTFIVLCIVLAISAFYEFIEWWVAVLTGTAADAFLGTQGYMWDTQSDMFLALLGGIAALLFLRATHDRQLAKTDSSYRVQSKVS